MKNSVMRMNRFTANGNAVLAFVSFRKFIAFINLKRSGETGIRKHFYTYVLEQFEACPELSGNIEIEKISEYEELLELVSSVVLPLIDDENEVLMGMGNALSPEIFYGTNAFYKIFSYCNGYDNQTFINSGSSFQLHKELQYNFILKELYGSAEPDKKEWIHSFTDPVSGLLKYYRLNIDSRFIEVNHKSALPVIDISEIKSALACDDEFERLEEIFPLNQFTASGFTIITLTDVTAQQAAEQIGKVGAEITEENPASFFTEVTQLLQTLAGSNKYRFGLMPFFTINNRSAILYENFPFSIIVKASWDAGISKENLSELVNQFISNPRLLSFDASVKNEDFSDSTQNALLQSGAYFYILMPVYNNNRLVGILETAAGKDQALPAALHLKDIKPAIPHISQLLQLFINKFNTSIDTIVKDKFTNIQPAVQWKFNEVAWHYFRSTKVEQKSVTLEKISFEDVFPLYGAVDMRNSTIDRNRALREDLQLHVTLLIDLFTSLKEISVNSEINNILELSNNWSQHLIHDIILDELNFDLFIKNEVHPYLKKLNRPPLHLLQKIEDYWNAADEHTGIIFQKRVQLEHSIHLINSALADYFNAFKEELQTLYPCYFEKFRTDGIEYDIYIGQSIAPKIPFTIQHLQKLRLWQVQSMAEIAKLTNSLLSQMQHPLQTTQLLYVNAHSIDICFRNDERRFDVEGTYNIRYHVIKKRIDKVHILQTLERLTQPQKIAIVYFDEKDAEEYAGYIHQLQQQEILQNDLEYLDLEELQGVSGLKALRVGVKLAD